MVSGAVFNIILTMEQHCQTKLRCIFNIWKVSRKYLEINPSNSRQSHFPAVLGKVIAQVLCDAILIFT